VFIRPEFRGRQQIKPPTYTATIKDPDTARAERKIESDQARYLRRRDTIILYYGLALLAIVFLTALGLLAFSSSMSKQDFAKQILLLIVGGFLGYLTGRATGGKNPK